MLFLRHFLMSEEKRQREMDVKVPCAYAHSKIYKLVEERRKRITSEKKSNLLLSGLRYCFKRVLFKPFSVPSKCVIASDAKWSFNPSSFKWHFG